MQTQPTAQQAGAHWWKVTKVGHVPRRVKCRSRVAKAQALRIGTIADHDDHYFYLRTTGQLPRAINDFSRVRSPTPRRDLESDADNSVLGLALLLTYGASSSMQIAQNRHAMDIKDEAQQ